MHQKQTKMARKRDIIFKKAEEKTIWNANIKMPDYNLHSLEPIKKELFDAIGLNKKKTIHINYLFHFCSVSLW